MGSVRPGCDGASGGDGGIAATAASSVVGTATAAVGATGGSCGRALLALTTTRDGALTRARAEKTGDRAGCGRRPFGGATIGTGRGGSGTDCTTACSGAAVTGSA